MTSLNAMCMIMEMCTEKRWPIYRIGRECVPICFKDGSDRIGIPDIITNLDKRSSKHHGVEGSTRMELIDIYNPHPLSQPISYQDYGILEYGPFDLSADGSE
jgi:hypothetical protein